MNAQTPGPLYLGRGSRLQTGKPGSMTAGRIVADMTYANPDWEASRNQTGRLLASAYTAFDRAGRELGVDAAELAERIDLAGLIRSAETLAGNSPEVSEDDERAAWECLRAELAKAKGTS